MDTSKTLSLPDEIQTIRSNGQLLYVHLILDTFGRALHTSYLWERQAHNSVQGTKIGNGDSGGKMADRTITLSNMFLIKSCQSPFVHLTTPIRIGMFHRSIKLIHQKNFVLICSKHFLLMWPHLRFSKFVVLA